MYIEPKVGRIVEVYISGEYPRFIKIDEQPMAAIIVHVNSPDVVNLVCFDHAGHPRDLVSIPLKQPDRVTPTTQPIYAVWPAHTLANTTMVDRCEAPAVGTGPVGERATQPA